MVHGALDGNENFIDIWTRDHLFLEQEKKLSTYFMAMILKKSKFKWSPALRPLCGYYWLFVLPALNENKEQISGKNNIKILQVIQEILYKVGAKEGMLLRDHGH